MLREEENRDIQVRMKDIDNDGQRLINRIKDNDVNQTLGCHINLTITNDNTKLTNTLVAKANKYNNDLLNSHLFAKQKRMTYTTCITPAVTFLFHGGTLGFTSLSDI